jgi:hypothetical protein
MQQDPELRTRVEALLLAVGLYIEETEHPSSRKKRDESVRVFLERFWSDPHGIYSKNLPDWLEKRLQEHQGIHQLMVADLKFMARRLGLNDPQF